jgi:GTPase SAR1 family protein
VKDIRVRSPDVPIILVGNKTDLEFSRVVFFEEAKKLADENKLLYVETSAKQGAGVSEAFTKLVDEVLKFHKVSPKNHSVDLKEKKGNYCCYSR